MKLRFVFSLVLLATCSSLFAQEKLGQLTVGDPEPLNEVVRRPDVSVLYVISEVPELKFENTLQIIAVQPRGASEWHVFLPPGRQRLTIRATGYQPIDTEVMNLEAKRAYGLKVSQVKPIPGTLFIKTQPDSANIRLNGAPINAKTPLQLDEALPGSYYVQLTKEGYRPVEKTLKVESRKVTEWQVELTQTAVRVQIDVKSKVQDVGILIDGDTRGVAPGAIYLEPGSYQLLLQKKGYKYTPKVIEIALGPEEIKLEEKLEAIKRPFYSKWWFLTGTAAAATGSAVFLFGPGKSNPAPPLAGNPEFP